MLTETIRRFLKLCVRVSVFERESVCERESFVCRGRGAVYSTNISIKLCVCQRERLCVCGV